MNEFTSMHPALLAASLGGALLVAAVAVAPLAAAYWLLTRAARGRSDAAAGAVAESTSAAALRHELLANYERLRRAGEAVTLATEAWARLRSRSDVLPAVVAQEVARAYQAAEIANRLLAASAAYDSRGHLSLRQRRLALWPTLEAALRSALAALGTDVAPARPQYGPGRAGLCRAQPAAAEIHFAGGHSARPAAVCRHVNQHLAASAAPRLALFYDTDGAAVGPAAERPPARLRPGEASLRRGEARPRAAKTRRPATPGRSLATPGRSPAARLPTRADADDRQMALWESVA